MKGTKTSNKLQDGIIRIHRRRAGICQPKDNLGLSCILQANNLDKYQLLSYGRKTLTIPQDNIGISCLPTIDSKFNMKLFYACEGIKDIFLKDTKNNALNSQQINNIGISNIRRPKSDKRKTRKPILPKDNIGLCCRLLQKSSTLKRNTVNTEKTNIKITCILKKEKNIKHSQSVPDFVRKLNNANVTKKISKMNIKDQKGF